MKIAKLEEKE